MKVTGSYKLLRETFAEWSEDKVPQLGASLAFYSAISLAPLLVIVLAFAALFFGDDAARGGVVTQLRGLVGEEGGKTIESMIQNANKPGTGVMATILSTITLLFGASGVFGQLQDSLNTIWEVKPKPGRGIWGVIKDRFLSFAMVLGVAFLLLVSLIITSVIAAVGEFAIRLPESLEWLIQILNFGVSFAVVTVLFAMIFKLLPDVKMAWNDVWLGAIGKLAIGIYLGHSTMASSYGVAGPLWSCLSGRITQRRYCFLVLS
jgi:membrane protein